MDGSLARAVSSLRRGLARCSEQTIISLMQNELDQGEGEREDRESGKRGRWGDWKITETVWKRFRERWGDKVAVEERRKKEIEAR